MPADPPVLANEATELGGGLADRDVVPAVIETRLSSGHFCAAFFSTAP